MLGGRINRATPRLPVGAYNSYAYGLPMSQWVRATCADYGCRAHLEGWRTVVDERTERGQATAYYVRHDSGRGFREHRDETGRTVFSFAPGQTCFAAAKHMVPSRPPLFVVRHGDWRQSLGVIRRHTRLEDWRDDLAESTDRLATIQRRG